MTLISNEVHLLDGLSKSVLVFAADRRISKPSGEYDSTRRKLFRIDYLNAGVSYFGLAKVFPNGRSIYMSTWLPDFIKKQSSSPDLEVFAFRLRDALNKIVPATVLKSNPSGFHMAGYNSDGYPDFFFFSNIGGMNQFKYIDLRKRYGEPSSHFLGRDAKKLGWDGGNPKSVRNAIHVYRNGDIRAHAVAWDKLDQILMSMFQFKDFKRPLSSSDYEEYVRTKFEIIAYIYKKFARKKIIARPIDVFCLHR